MGWINLPHLLCLTLLCTSSLMAFCQDEIVHKIDIIHKGISLTETIECTLVEAREKETESFYMDVESVVCGDSLCRVDIVRLYWDKYARFIRLELPGEVELEKAEGKAFTESDYLKLDSVLRNESSPLSDLYTDQIVGTLASEGVDAVSRASVSINKRDYVEGAIWTCYSLWHWVHGDSKEIIRNLTGDATSLPQLKSLLSSTDRDLQYFAIEQLGRRKEYSDEISEFMLASLKDAPDLVGASLDYWEGAPDWIYKHAVKRVLVIPDKEIRLLGLSAVFRSRHSLAEIDLQNLPLSYEQMTYQEVQLLLRILKKYDLSSPGLIENLLPLLDLDDFLIARGVYWYLADQELNKSQEKRLEDFYNKWKKKL